MEAALSVAWTRVTAWQGSCQTLGLWSDVMGCASYCPLSDRSHEKSETEQWSGQEKCAITSGS